MAQAQPGIVDDASRSVRRTHFRSGGCALSRPWPLRAGLAAACARPPGATLAAFGFGRPLPPAPAAAAFLFLACIAGLFARAARECPDPVPVLQASPPRLCSAGNDRGTETEPCSGSRVARWWRTAGPAAWPPASCWCFCRRSRAGFGEINHNVLFEVSLPAAAWGIGCV